MKVFADRLILQSSADCFSGYVAVIAEDINILVLTISSVVENYLHYLKPPKNSVQQREYSKKRSLR